MRLGPSFVQRPDRLAFARHREIMRAQDSGGAPYATDVTTDTQYELVQTVSVSAPPEPEFLHAHRVEASIGGKSIGAGQVDCGYAFRFGADAYSAITALGSFVYGSSQNHCGLTDGSTPQSVGLDVSHRGPPATSLDVRFYLRRELGGNTVEYCIRSARVIGTIRRHALDVGGFP